MSIATVKAAPVYGNTRVASQSLLTGVVAAARQLSLMYSIYGERRQLRKLSGEALRDMGLSPADIEKECSRKFSDIAGCRR